MSIKDGRDYLFLIWQEQKTRKRYVVGELSKNGQYEFSYGYEVDTAIENGFELLIAFPELKTVYKNDSLFSVFSGRLPDPKRKGIERILTKYGLDSYDSYRLLKASGAKLPIDDLEFIDPIFDADVDKCTRKFYVAGPRYYLGCNGDVCEKSIVVSVDEELSFIPEPENPYDDRAVQIVNGSGVKIGYLPRYYAEGIRQVMARGNSIDCKVIEINKENNCSECIKVELVVSK